MALKLVKEHRKDALTVASQWLRCADRAGDPKRYKAWLQIESLVHKLLNSADVSQKLKSKTAKARQAVETPVPLRITSHSEALQPAPPAE